MSLFPDGSIVFTINRDLWVSGAIAWVADSPYSHVLVSVGKVEGVPMVIEASMKTGVTLTPESHYNEPEYNWQAYSFVGLLAADREAAQKQLLQTELGKPYGWWNGAKVGLRELAGYVGIETNLKPDKARECADLVWRYTQLLPWNYGAPFLPFKGKVRHPMDIYQIVKELSYKGKMRLDARKG